RHLPLDASGTPLLGFGSSHLHDWACWGARMRLRAGLILFVLLALIPVVGGRGKPLEPTFDRNQAPETWITAAPLDTITLRDGPNPVETAPGRIPSRVHLYCAGSDADGKVAGIFFSVVETL